MPLTGRTAWARNLAAPVRDFLSTETGSAIVLLAATIAALALGQLAWPDSYAALWTTELDRPARRLVAVGRPARLGQRRPDDLLLPRRRPRGQARARPRRAARAPAPGAAGRRGGSAACSCPSPSTWRSTPAPTAAAAGARRCRPTPRSRSGSSRWRRRAAPRACACSCSRSRSSTTSCALIVIAIAYSENVSLTALAVAIGLLRRARRCCASRRSARTPAAAVVGVAIWVAMFESGIHPTIAGLAIGLATSAYPPARGDLEARQRALRARSASSPRPSSRARPSSA